jgi:2-dehydropantoate 2-reductase
MAFAPGRADADGIKVVEWLRDYTAVGAKTHSGIWRDLAVRKRKTEAEAQLMIMPRLAAQKRIATPALTALGDLIKDIEEGRREQSPESFNALLDAIA